MVVKPDEKEISVEEPRECKKPNEFATTKLIMRRLPPTITESELLEQIAPLPHYDYFYFAPPDPSLSPWLYSRAYFHLTSMEDVILFRDRFDGYIFMDSKGNEYPAMVELAPSQKFPTRKPKKDPKCGTIDQDPAYQKFLEELQNPKPVELPSMATILAEIEKREKEAKEAKGCKAKTPLIEFVIMRKEEKRKRIEDKRKQREDERIRRAEERQRRIEREIEEKRRQKRLEEEKRKEAESRIEQKKLSESEKPQQTREKAPRFAKKQAAAAAIRQRDYKGDERDNRHSEGDKSKKRIDADNAKKIISIEKHDVASTQRGLASVEQAESSESKDQKFSKVKESVDKKESAQRKPSSKGSRYKDKPSMPIYQPAQRRKQLEVTEKPLLFKDVDEN